MSRHCSYLPYVLITPARNEEAFIERAIRSVICQTVLPAKWVIVDDGSTDSTAGILERYLPRDEWVGMVSIAHPRDRSFAAKICSFHAGDHRGTGLPDGTYRHRRSDVSIH